jgi:hypothetical protein
MYRDIIFRTSYNIGNFVIVFMERNLTRMGKIFQCLAVSHAVPNRASKWKLHGRLLSYALYDQRRSQYPSSSLKNVRSGFYIFNIESYGRTITDLHCAAFSRSVILFQASKEQNVPKEQLYKTVQRILDEIGYDRQLPVIRWLGMLLLKVLKRTCSSLCVNESSINRVSCNWTCLGAGIFLSLE